MSKWYRVFMVMAGFFVGTAAMADAAVLIQLVGIERLAQSEQLGDELYFNVTEYSNLSSPEHFQVPSYPIHWLSDHLDQVKKVTLWQRRVKTDEAVEVVLSLTERDAPPWNLDDLIGTVKVKFKLIDTGLEQHWQAPQGEALPLEVQEDNMHQRHFMLSGENTQYRLQFALSSIDEAP